MRSSSPGIGSPGAAIERRTRESVDRDEVCMLKTWIIIGAAMIFLELFLPGMVLGFLGSSALVVAACIWLGWIEGWVSALTTWFILSLFLMLTLRGLVQRFAGGESEQESTDEEADAYGTLVDVVETITPTKQGRIHYRDASWQATCHDHTIAAGGKATLAYRDNLVWIVEAAIPDEYEPT
jgi:membrane protein implicated in regulation of membrane protease activity